MKRTNITIQDYHADKTHISSSGLKWATKSLKHFAAWLRGDFDREKKPAFEFGNAFELFLMDRTEFDRAVFIYDESNRPEPDKGITSKANQEWKRAIYSQADRYIIPATGDDSAEIMPLMYEAAEQQPIIMKLLRGSEYQNSYYWQCAETGLKLKARPDLVRADKQTIIDIKTAHSAEPWVFASDAVKYNYPLQALMQIEGVEFEVEHYFWLVFEKKPPYDVVLFEFALNDRVALADGYLRLKQRVADAMNAGEFPGYAARALNEFGIVELDLPGYYSL